MNLARPASFPSILGGVDVPTDPDLSGAYPGSPGGDGPQTLGDLQTHLRMSRTGWLIAFMFLGAALSFFIVVVCLGVVNS